MKLYFIIPVMDERGTLEELTEGILASTADHETTILFINDGSTDGTREVLDELAAKHDAVEVVHFDVNRGKSAALLVGFEKAEGDVIFTMDGDLQDDPVEIPNYLSKLDEGYDLVCGWKFVRHDPWHKTLPSKVYNGIVGMIFGLDLHDINCGYKAMTLEVAKSLNLKHDYHRLVPVFAKLKGFRITEIHVQHHARRYGHSKYGLARFWHGLRDVFRVWLGK
ncbi:MAG: glycosyltransferase family 2 protein [Candidatus Hydrogenedentota bacterium]